MVYPTIKEEILLDTTMLQRPSSGCPDETGLLPTCAALANPYVPYQQENPKTYQADTGLVRGTLYPGLDLPFMGLVNKNDLRKTELHQLQALHFAINELGLYLDTHKNDQDALELFNQYVEQYEAALQRMEERHGPRYRMSAGMSGTYRWTEGPWPWEYNANKEG